MRYYDPQLGRYLSTDPIGISGGDLNLYSYVQENPVGISDPSGLQSPYFPPEADPMYQAEQFYQYSDSRVRDAANGVEEIVKETGDELAKIYDENKETMLEDGLKAGIGKSIQLFTPGVNYYYAYQALTTLAEIFGGSPAFGPTSAADWEQIQNKYHLKP